MPGGMGDDEGNAFRRGGHYAGDTAGPKNRYLTLFDGHGIPKIRLFKSVDSNHFRGSQMNGGAMGKVKSCGGLRGANGMFRAHGSHGDNQRR